MRRIHLPLFASFAIAGCIEQNPSSHSPSEEPEGLASLSVSVAPVAAIAAARSTAADVGGMLVMELANGQKGIRLRDSASWIGTEPSSIAFPSLTEGAGYSLRAWYRDPQGYTTHGDSVGGIVLTRGQSATLNLAMRALLGKIVLNAPSLPSLVDTLSLRWSSKGSSRVARACRGSGGRTTLRLDSLPIAQEGSVHLRAWNSGGDTLFHLDTAITLHGDADPPLSLVLQSSRGLLSAGVSFLSGGEIDATASFAGESDQPSSQTGRLLMVTFSDSGSSDWIGIRNPGSTRFTGPLRLGKGSSDGRFDLDLPAGETAVVTRAPCAAIDSAHPLRSARLLVCGIDAVVVTHSTSGGSLWMLRSDDGSELLDEVLVLDGKQSWPDLNTSNARTARLRDGWPGAAGNDAGRAWCADGFDDAGGKCH